MTTIEDPQTYAIIGAALTVHQELGPGFLENVYHEALAIELEQRAIPFKHEVELSIFYRGRPLNTTYRTDFICFDVIIVELKALPAISRREKAQVLNYLKAANFRRGLLINFGSTSLEHARLVNNWQTSA